MAGGFFGAVVYGASLALQFNPLFALVGATIAAALFTLRERIDHARMWAASALVLAWLVGDGLRIIARTRDIYDGFTLVVGRTAPPTEDYIAVVVWALLGFLVGYVLPAWAGAFVGRRVTHGTGWLAAGSIAFTTSLALSTLVALIS